MPTTTRSPIGSPSTTDPSSSDTTGSRWPTVAASVAPSAATIRYVRRKVASLAQPALRALLDALREAGPG